MSPSSLPDKRERLERISNEYGQFSMLAVDQRQSLRTMINDRFADDGQASGDKLTLIKRIVAETMAPQSTALLLDPVYGFPSALEGTAYSGGLLVAAEKTGYRSRNGHERLTRLVDTWEPERWRRNGVDAVKLLLWHHPGASDATLRHQREIAQQVGRQCAEAGLAFLLEAKVYDLDRNGAESEWARKKPELVIDAATTFSDARFEVDMLKLDFPGDLKYTDEFQPPAVRWGSGTAVYDVEEVRGYCRRLNKASSVPWVILSAGVVLEEFIACIEMANEAGASGFLCGRTAWKHMLDDYPNENAMREYLEGEGRRRFQLIKQANQNALSWQEHSKFSASEDAPPGKR